MLRAQNLTFDLLQESQVAVHQQMSQMTASMDQLVREALDLYSSPYAYESLGKHKRLLMLFFNPSLRTRLSTEVAAQQLGMHVISMNASEGWKLELADGSVMRGDTAEHVREAAGVIGQYADIIAVRSFPGLVDREQDYADTLMKAFVRHTGKPVISLESATRHPLQSLADWMTILEHQPRQRPKVVLSWAPHPRVQTGWNRHRPQSDTLRVCRRRRHMGPLLPLTVAARVPQRVSVQRARAL
jgi:ornithine carbamoyltransferase